jgi:uncharacterized protein YndB with AHSA1/START domain
MIKFIFIGLVLIVIVFVVVVALRPADFRIQRSATIAAPPATVFAHVNDVHKFQEWSPWAKMDPNSKIVFEGPEAGTGAKFSWAGNKDVGEGAMTVTDSKPAELVQFRLDFKKPFEATNTDDFSFKPDGDKTVVTWGMSGKNNFMFKAVGLFMDCDKMVGKDFEKGLDNLKTLAEAEAKK